jgi:hypothetical protein
MGFCNQKACFAQESEITKMDQNCEYQHPLNLCNLVRVDTVRGLTTVVGGPRKE